MTLFKRKERYMAKQYSFRQFRILLRRNGYVFDRFSGDHCIFVNDVNTISIPFHGKEINRMLAQRLIKENNLKED